MTDILLTGSTGCLGSHVLEELATLDEDISVKLLIRNTTKWDELVPQLELGELDYEVIQGDLGDFNLIREIVKEMDAVFHVAAVFDFESPWERFEHINVEGTREMIKAMQPGSTFILTSSDGIYGFPNLDRGMREDEEPNPFGNYHKSKLMQEEVTRELCPERNIKYAIVRPTNIVGPRDSMTVTRVVKGIKKRSMILIRGGEHLVSLVHPVDIAKGHILAYQNINSIDGEAFHFTSINVSWKEYIHRFCEELDEEPINRSVPYFLAYFIGFLGDIWPWDSIYSRFNVKFAGTNHELDISKAKEMLGYQPSKNLDDIAKESVRWYKMQVENGS